ncbi:MAG: hypothetical protein ACW964_14605 [Candidatus Hodarchaeales archaeon]|jgi:hypothetical protein
MKKIYILVGAVLLLVLIIMCWFFIFQYFDFAQNLGKKSEGVALIESSRFIGNWETDFIEGDDRFIGYNGILIFHGDKTGSIGGLTSTWDIKEGQLIIYYYEGMASVTYDYSFSEDEKHLTLTNSNGFLEYIKIEH